MVARIKLKVASLFCGGGGTDLGFVGGFKHLGVKYAKLPYEIVWAVDNDRDAIAVYKANQKKLLGKHPLIYGDIRDVELESVPDFDVLLAGFPCQPFSNAGNRKGVDDHRGTLFEEVEKFVKAKKPMAFVLENVKGILSSRMANGKTVPEEICERLAEVTCDDGEVVRYQIPEARLVKAHDYGVPQQRHRVLIVGVREDVGGEFNFEDLYRHTKKKSLDQVYVRDILKDLPRNDSAAEVWKLSPQAQNMAPMIKRSWKDIPYDKLPDRFKRIRDNIKRYRSPNFYRRFSPDEVNGTITASAQPENCGILHPHENRRYSVREIARIQSFPDDFVFPCTTMPAKYKVIGNAVPPVLAYVVAKALYQHVQAHVDQEECYKEVVNS